MIKKKMTEITKSKSTDIMSIIDIHDKNLL